MYLDLHSKELNVSVMSKVYSVTETIRGQRSAGQLYGLLIELGMRFSI